MVNLTREKKKIPVLDANWNAGDPRAPEKHPRFPRRAVFMGAFPARVFLVNFISYRHSSRIKVSQ